MDAAFSAAAMAPGAGDPLAAAGIGAKGAKAAEGAIDTEKTVRAARGAEEARTAQVVAPTSVLPSSGKTWVGTGRDTFYDVPAGWTQRMADHDEGLVFQEPGAIGKQDQVPIAEPNPHNPAGYVRVYNKNGQAVTPLGTTGRNMETHTSQLCSDPFPAWPTS